MPLQIYYKNVQIYRKGGKSIVSTHIPVTRLNTYYYFPCLPVLVEKFYTADNILMYLNMSCAET